MGRGRPTRRAAVRATPSSLSPRPQESASPRRSLGRRERPRGGAGPAAAILGRRTAFGGSLRRRRDWGGQGVEVVAARVRGPSESPTQGATRTGGEKCGTPTEYI
jgi:hypothetical protein